MDQCNTLRKLLRNSQRQRHPTAARLRRSLQQMQNLQPSSKRHMPSSHSSRRKSQRSRSRSNLYGKGNDRQELQITTVIAGRTDSKLLSHTPVLHAVLEKLDIKRTRQDSPPWVEYSGAKNDTEGQLRTYMIK
jgi:hypothetical protein